MHLQAKDEQHETCLLMKRDLNVVASVYVEPMLKMKEKMSEMQDEVSTDSPVSQTDKFFSDPTVLKYVDNVVNKMIAMKRAAESMPSFDLGIPELRDYNVPKAARIEAIKKMRTRQNQGQTQSKKSSDKQQCFET